MRKCEYEGTGVWDGRCIGTKEVDPCTGYDKCKQYKPNYTTNADRIRATGGITMDVMEKLVEILKQAPFEGKVLDEWWWEEKIKRIAEHLIAHGVTVQEWVPVNDKLPPYNHDVLVYRPNMAMKFLVDNYEGYYGEDDSEWYEGWSKYGTDIHGNPVITHWAYLPQPPKGE